MLELIIIRQLLIKAVYDKYRSYIKVPDELRKHYSVLDKLQGSYDRDLTLQEFILHAQQAGCQFLKTLEDSHIGEDSVTDLLNTLAERNAAYEIAMAAVEVSEGRKTVEHLLEQTSRLDDIQIDEDEEDFVTDDLEAIMEATDRTRGIKWRLPDLRQLGGLVQGTFGFVFARSGTGKTTFLASEMAFFAKQTERPVIWINNEEEKHKVKSRLIQAALGWTDEQMRQDLTRTKEAYTKLTGGRIHLYDSAAISARDVEKLVKKYKPEVIVIDSIDEIVGFKADRSDERYGEIYRWARSLAKDNCAVIGVCQASATAENKKWLTMTDVAESNTSKQKHADFIIGIGKTQDTGSEDIRYIHIVKDKCNVKFPRIECRIQPDIARYVEL